MTPPLLKVDGLSIEFGPKSNPIRAVNGVSFEIDAGGAVGIVGESGSGKSVTSLSILRLIPDPPGRIAEGRIELNGVNLLDLPQAKMPEIRGRDIAMIFQEPMSSLNPLMTIGDQIGEAIMLHESLGREARRRRVIEVLNLVGIPDAAGRIDAYPHQFSGGMRQRVMIAIALSCNPKLLIADEPTTALDVTIQAQILDLLERLREEHEMAMIIITHDMGVVAEAADDVAVMYAGQIVEQAPVLELFERPEHPYTEALLGALPQLEGEGIRAGRLTAIPGRPPDLVDPPEGCRFADRCPYRDEDTCADTPQELREIRQGHLVRTAHPASERGRTPQAVTT